MRCLTLLALVVATTAAHAGERCGPNECGDDEVCCNRGCGICAPKPGGACIDLLCEWGEPVVVIPGDAPSTDIYDRQSAGGGISVAGDGDDVDPFVTAGVQRYLGHAAALRLEVMTAHASFAAGVGGTMLLPALAPFLISAVSLDVQVGEDGARAALGVAATTHMRVFEIFGHARYQQLVDDAGAAGGLDLGAGLAVYRPYWANDFNSPMPIALSVGYRHRHELYGTDALVPNELDAGAYVISGGLHLGVEAWVSFDGNVTTLLRVDNYSDVEF